MAKTIYQMVTAPELAVYWNENLQNRAPFVGEQLFPSVQQLGLSLSWIKGANSTPVVLKLSAFDAKSIKRDRIGVDKVTVDMPFFKESMGINETDRQNLNLVLSSGNQKMIDIVLNKIFKDDMTLLEGAAVARERMRMQLLTTGVISMANNGQTYSYDYGVPAGNKVAPTTLWSNVAADIIGDIIKWQDQIAGATGVRPTRAICTSTIIGYMLKNTAIKAGFTATNSVLTPGIVRQYILDMTGVTIFVNDAKFTNESAALTNYVPTDIFTLFPEGNLGNTYFGTTPEESDLMTSAKANVSIVDGGVAITTTEETDPVSVDTKVSMICLPSFEMADKIYIADVA
jgi:hypothetical protein